MLMLSDWFKNGSLTKSMPDMMKRLELIKNWGGGKPSPPCQLTITPTYVCNLRCRFCAQRLGPRAEDVKKTDMEIDEKILLRFVKEAAAMGIHIVNISGGGEPFLRDKTLRIMALIKSLGMGGGITTNGTHLTEDKIRKIVEIGWNSITFSIDAPEADTQDYLRDSRGTFHRAINSIKQLQHIKKRLGRGTPVVSINTVLVKNNCDRIHNMIELCSKLDVREFTLIQVTVHHEEGEPLRITEVEWKDFQDSLMKARKLAKKYHINTNLDEFTDIRFVTQSNEMAEVLLGLREIKTDSDRDKSDIKTNKLKKRANGLERYSNAPCFEPWLTLVIHPDGYIDPCEMNNNISHIGGRSLSELWYNDSNLNQVREMFLRRELPPTCKKCCGPLVSRNIELRKLLRDGN